MLRPTTFLLSFLTASSVSELKNKRVLQVGLSVPHRSTCLLMLGHQPEGGSGVMLILWLRVEDSSTAYCLL